MFKKFILNCLLLTISLLLSLTAGCGGNSGESCEYAEYTIPAGSAMVRGEVYEDLGTAIMHAVDYDDVFICRFNGTDNLSLTQFEAKVITLKFFESTMTIEDPGTCISSQGGERIKIGGVDEHGEFSEEAMPLLLNGCGIQIISDLGYVRNIETTGTVTHMFRFSEGGVIDRLQTDGTIQLETKNYTYKYDIEALTSTDGVTIELNFDEEEPNEKEQGEIKFDNHDGKGLGPLTVISNVWGEESFTLTDPDELEETPECNLLGCNFNQGPPVEDEEDDGQED